MVGGAVKARIEFAFIAALMLIAVVGYFFGGDLLPAYPGSNKREVFFAFAPKPASGTCPAVTRSGALRSLPPVSRATRRCNVASSSCASHCASKLLGRASKSLARTAIVSNKHVFT